MSVKLHGLRTVVYMVPDLAKAKEWYTTAFGITPYFDEPFYVGFNVGGYELGLHPAEGHQPATTLGGTVYWGVDDVQKSFDELLAAGATTLEPPSDVGGGIVVATLADPWGNPIGIIYNPHFKL